jgi:hypothetical protein
LLPTEWRWQFVHKWCDDRATGIQAAIDRFVYQKIYHIHKNSASNQSVTLLPKFWAKVRNPESGWVPALMGLVSQQGYPQIRGYRRGGSNYDGSTTS